MWKFVTASLLAGGLAGPAMAQSAVTATTDLNVRQGPGPQFPIMGVIEEGESASLRGCIEGSKWCSIASSAGEGWVYSDYLTADLGGSTIVLSERPANSGITVVDPPAASGSSAGAAAGGTVGAVTGAIIGGPVGAVVGGAAGAVAGSATGAAIDPPPQVIQYVETNRVDPVYLEGEVVIGAGLPETVVLQDIPDYEYRYAYLNGQPVLVDASTRRIVYIVR